jgi:uncharacterized protein YjbI with pentapeptide repeats
MALPVTVPNTFANATTSIPLSQLDANFSTLSNAINGINSGAETLVNLKASNVTITGGTISNITLDNVTVDVETLSNITLTNVTVTSGTFTGITAANIAGANISSGNATLTNVTATQANLTTANVTNLQSGNVVVTGGTLTGITAANIAGANISSGNVTITIASLANGNAAAPSLRFTDDTDTGVFLSGANAISFTEGGTGYRMGYRNIPDGGPKNASYTLTAADVGKYVQIIAGGSITVPDGTFSNGDVVSLYNNTNAAVTVNCAISTAYIAGTDSDKANVSLATRGVATVLFANANVCVITGNVS